MAEDAKNQIMDDFGMKSDQNNKRLLINLLDYKGVMYSNSDKRWVYSLKRYRGKFNDNLFLISGVAMDGNFIKERLTDVERERLEKMTYTVSHANKFFHWFVLFFVTDHIGI